MPSGVVKTWHSEKGFGFISPNEGGEDIFCHVSDLLDGEGSVYEGDEVRYTIKFDDRKGKDRAAEVELKSGGGGGRDRGPPPRDNRGYSRERSRGRNGGGRSGGGGGRSGGGGGSGTGLMLRWDGQKGFGFIQPDDGGEDLFCHVTSLLDGEGSVMDGDQVSFIKEFNDRKGKWAAVEVRASGGGGGRRGRSRSRGGRDSHRGGGRDFDRGGGRDYDRGGRDFDRGGGRDYDRGGSRGYDDRRR